MKTIRAGGLSTSDRIVEVDGVRLDSTDHEKAVAAIQVLMVILMVMMRLMMLVMMIMITMVMMIMRIMMEVVISMRTTKTNQGAPDAIIFMVQSLHNWVSNQNHDQNHNHNHNHNHSEE